MSIQPSQLDPEVASSLSKKGAPVVPVQKFVHDGRVVYEWEQTIDEVKLWIRPPPAATSRMLDVDISEQFLFVGIKGNRPFLHEQFTAQIKLDETMWMFDEDDGVIEVSLQKQKKGQPWSAVFVGHGQLNPLVEQQVVQCGRMRMHLWSFLLGLDVECITM